MSKGKKTTVDFSKDSHYDEKVLTGIKLFVRSLTYRDIFKRLNKHKKRDVSEILELGSGSGYFIKFASEKFPNAKISALEFDNRLHDTIRKNAPNAEISSQNAENFNYQKKFDLIVSTHVIEHLYNPERMISCIYDHMENHGTCIITTPNIKSFGHRIHKTSWNGIRPDHVSLMSLRDLTRAMEGAGFTVEYAGSTFFSGIKIFRTFPFRLVNDFLLLIFGSLSWDAGEALIVVANKLK